MRSSANRLGHSYNRLRFRPNRMSQSHTRMRRNFKRLIEGGKLLSLRQNRRKLLLRGAFHGSTVIAHPPALEKRAGVLRMAQASDGRAAPRGKICSIYGEDPIAARDAPARLTATSYK